MALRNILTKEDMSLHKKSRKVEHFDRRLWDLLDDMKETLRHANGVGLAAPQVGVLRRVVIVEILPEEELVELINPVVLRTKGEQEGEEGCLSVPGVYGIVKRPMVVTVRAVDRQGKPFELSGEGVTARAFMHEIDHLDGRLFTELVSRYLSPEELAPEGGL